MTDEAINWYLRKFTTGGITSESQKRALRKAGLIEYRDGWQLSAAGLIRAERLGYL